MRSTKLLPLLLAGLALSPAWSATLYVSPDGAGTDGLSWETAFQKVGDAIIAAASGDDLWIKQGLYLESIALTDGLSLYGGFAGTETPLEFDRRDPKRRPTTLDGSGTGSTVISILAKSDTLLDGLRVTGGAGVKRGAGVYILSSPNASLINCNIQGNKASGEGFAFGGGIYAEDSSIVLRASSLMQNQADDGCGLYLLRSTGEILDSTVASNRGRLSGRGIFGGGIFARESTLSVRGCSVFANSDMAIGGGILLSICNGLIENTRILNNRATDGAGIDISSSNPMVQLVNCEIDGNVADGQLPGGGGIKCSGSTIIQDCTITNNVGGGNGGGIHIDQGPCQVLYCRIEGNRAREGGGLSTRSQSREDLIRDSEIGSNTAEVNGGGIAAQGSGLVIDNCSITGNTMQATQAGNGGGGGIYARHIRLKESTISGNRSSGFGGGIRAVGLCNLENCLIFDNSALFQGGAFSTINYEPFIQNCVFANNSAGMPGKEIFVGRTNGLISKVEPVFAGCIIWNASVDDLIFESGGANPLFRYCDIRGGWEGEGNIDADPLFIDAQLGDFRPRPNSPCIDNASTSGPLADFDAKPRPVDVLGRGTEGPGAFDMGAFEFQIPLGDLNSNGQFEPLDLFIFQRDWLKATDVAGS